jgi:predicted phage terminase large subunit-like protein
MFGGAAGGGKSDALLMAALQYAHVPGYAALLFRRSYPDLALPGAIMDRAGDWLRGTDARWKDQDKTWMFPSGATVTFGYLQYENDKYRYQGAEFQFVGFDELTQFSDTQYRFLLSRLRRLAGAAVPIRARCASNPGGIGHAWVKARFVDPDTSTGRRFIPARLEDNPHLDAEEYERSLAELDPVTRRQLRMGDWDVTPEGGMFRREWFEIVAEAPADLDVVSRSWDEAATDGGGDWTVGAKVGHKAGVWYVLDVIREQVGAQGVDKLMDQAAALDGWPVTIDLQQEPGSAGKARADGHTRRLTGRAVRVGRPTGSKATRARILSSAAEAGNVKLVAGPWCPAFLEEAVLFPASAAHDDQIDAVSWAMLMMSDAARGGAHAGVPAHATLLGSQSRGDTGPKRYSAPTGAGARYGAGTGGGRYSRGTQGKGRLG